MTNFPSAAEYADIMNNLNLPDPKMMDVAVPANLTIGEDLKRDPEIARATLSVADAAVRLTDGRTLFIDLRESGERARDGIIPRSVHVPYRSLDDALKRDGLLAAMLADGERDALFYCAHGERSALALKAAREHGFERVAHLGGGLAAWREAGGVTETD